MVSLYPLDGWKRGLGVNEVRNADIFTQKCTLHLQPFGFASTQQDIVPKCLMETPGGLWTGARGQQAMCAFQNTGPTDFRLWNQIWASAESLWVALIMASSQGKLLLPKRLFKGGSWIPKCWVRRGFRVSQGPTSWTPLNTDPRKKFPGSTGTCGPGGSRFELGQWQHACDPHTGSAGPSTEASNQQHLLRVKGCGWPGQQISLSVTECWQRSSAGFWEHRA